MTANAALTAALAVAVAGMTLGVVGTFASRRGSVLQHYATYLGAISAMLTFVFFLGVILTRTGLR